MAWEHYITRANVGEGDVNLEGERFSHLTIRLTSFTIIIRYYLQSGGYMEASTKASFDTGTYRYRVTVEGLDASLVFPYTGTSSPIYKNDVVFRAPVSIVVEREIKNTAPTTPGEFTSPASGTVLKGGETVTLRWGASSDAEGNAITYELQYNYNNSGSWITANSSVNSSNYLFTVTTGLNITQISFRVRAKDSNNTYSSYINSPTFTISHNSAPTITVTTIDNTPIIQDQSITIPTETSYQFKLTANDTDTGQTHQYKLSVAGVETIPLKNITVGTETTLTIEKTSFIVGMNAADVTVQDNQGGVVSMRFNVIVDANMPIDSSCLANMRFNGYSLSTLSLAELVNHLE